MDDAWLVVAHLRDLWTAATANVGKNADFPRPFYDMEFFEHLHRHADRRCPWAMLYLTPDAICRAALLSVIEENIMTDSQKLQALRQYIAERAAWLKDFIYHHQCNIPEPTMSEASDYSEATGELAALEKIDTMIDGW